MSAALRQAPRPAAARPDFPALRLEDFSTRLPADDLAAPGIESLRLARMEGQAEGAALARDRQMEELTEALRRHGEAMAATSAAQARQARETRAEIADLLRAVAGALLPRGGGARLVAELVGALEDAGETAPSRAHIHCPAHLHDALRQACRDAGLTMPTLTAAPEPALHLDGGVTRVDLAAMQERLLRLIDDYATGEP